MSTISNLNSFQMNYNINKNNTKTEEITVETLTEDLEEYNEDNNTDVLFIDLLEKISFKLNIKDKISISKNGNELLKQLDAEISKMNGKIAYEDGMFQEIKDNRKLTEEISKLKLKLLSETNKDKILILQTEILTLETQLLTELS